MLLIGVVRYNLTEVRAVKQHTKCDGSSSFIFSYNTISVPNGFSELNSGMTLKQVKALVGEPDCLIGSGLTLFEYYIDNDSSVILGFGTQMKVLDREVLVNIDGQEEIII
jgi:hypothetical protein